MTIKQAYNSKRKAWVKYDFKPGVGSTIVDMKQREPTKPFKGVAKRGNRR